MNKILMSVALLLYSSFADSHTTSTSYLNLNLENDTVSGTWKVAVVDMDLMIALDNNEDGLILWREILSRKKQIISEFSTSILVSSNKQVCDLTVENILIDKRKTGVYLHFPFHSSCRRSNSLSVSYQYMFDQDAFHKAIISVKNFDQSQSSILNASNRHFSYTASNVGLFKQVYSFITQGIWHVLIGLDHVVFVICLLLACTIVGKTSTIKANSPKQLLGNSLKLITAFTVAHSITLSLAATKTVSLPVNYIELSIAISVLIVASLNIFSSKIHNHWKLAFIFGLIHGFGFANVLEDIPLQHSNIITSLLGFNIGVEIGQVFIIALILPVLFIFRSKKIYTKLIMPGSSIAIALMSVVWIIERSRFMLV